ncbi:MAG: hypothetical protein QXJ74_08635 [Nitrososphaera sp.]
MSEEKPRIGRPQVPELDMVKLDLLSNLNMLRMEVWIFNSMRKSLSYQISVTQGRENEDVSRFVLGINERLDYLLRIAKNLLKNPNDEDDLEYKAFEELANRTVRQGIEIKKKRSFRKKKF